MLRATIRSFLCSALMGAVLVASLGATIAWAEGGTSIAAAPAVTYGQQEFGNLSSQVEEYCKHYRSWWTLPVTAGDLVQIDWEAQGAEVDLNLFEAGTTDFNFPQTSTVAFSSVTPERPYEYLSPRPSPRVESTAPVN